MCMRTNIELDEALVEEAMRYSKASTKRALVDEALRNFVEVKAAEERRRTYAEKLEEIRRRTITLKLRKSPAEILREDRDRS